MSIEELLDVERSQIKLALRGLRKKRTELERKRKKLVAKVERLKRKLAKFSKKTKRPARKIFIRRRRAKQL